MSGGRWLRTWATRASSRRAVVGVERACWPTRCGQPGQRHAAHLQAIVDDGELGLRGVHGLGAGHGLLRFQTAWTGERAAACGRFCRSGCAAAAPRAVRYGPAPCRPAGGAGIPSAAPRRVSAAPSRGAPAARWPGPAPDAARRRPPLRPPARVAYTHFLDLGRADAVAGHLDHVVAAADEVQEAVVVARARCRPTTPPSRSAAAPDPGRAPGLKRSAVLAGSFQ